MKSVIGIVALLTCAVLSTAFECDPEKNGQFPHEYCDKYWDCYNGVQTLVTCPNNRLFDTRWGSCELPNIVDCGDRIRPGTTTTTTGPTTTTTTTEATTTTTTKATTTTAEPTTTTTTTTGSPIEFECPADGNFPDPKDCRSFYQCSNGIPYHVTCARPLFYDIGRQLCNFQDQVQCGSRPIPE